MIRLAQLLTATALALAGRTLLAADYYVAPCGNDANPGTKAKPFAGLLRARDVIRAERRAGALGEGPCVVNVCGGTYRVMETLGLTAKDSGTGKAPVIWRAAPGDAVRWVGGVRLKDFQPVTDSAILERLDPAARGKVLQVDLKAAGVADLGHPTSAGGSRTELICNNQYMPLARYPNSGEWLKIANVPKGGTKHARPDKDRGTHYGRFTYDGDRPRRWKDTSDLWVHGYWVYDWRDQYHRVKKLDLDKKEVWPEPPYHGYGYCRGQRFYFLNILEELDSPGEWYLDRKTGRLYFWPPSDPAKAEVLFPELGKPMIALKETQHVRICGMVFECSRSSAITVAGGNHNEIAGCTFRNFGAEVTLTVGGTENGVRSCDLYELAGTAIRLRGGDRKTLTPAKNYAVNNHIHHVGRVFRTYHGAFSLGGVGNRIAHCYIHDLPHQGIGYSGNDHVIEYCDFTRIAQETGDVGVTYAAADWTFMGHEFRYNYFHNVHGPGRLGCFTIYPDLPCGGIHLHHNVFYDVDQGFYTNSGRAMLIENNVFLRCGKTAGFGVWRDAKMFREGGPWRMVEHLKAVNYDRPPYSTRYPVLRQLAEDFSKGVEHILQRELPKDNLIRRNVSWGGLFLHLGPLASLEHVKVENNVIADDVVFTGSFDGSGKGAKYSNGDATIAAEFGKRGNVILKDDPGFGNLAARDFSLKPDSPAWKLGFEPIPFKQIGLVADEYRKTLALVVYAPVINPSSGRFQGKLTVRITPTPSPRGPECVVRYTTDGTEPTAEAPIYAGPITITSTTTLKAAAFVASGSERPRSETASAVFTAVRAGKDGP